MCAVYTYTCQRAEHAASMRYTALGLNASCMLPAVLNAGAQDV